MIYVIQTYEKLCNEIDRIFYGNAVGKFEIYAVDGMKLNMRKKLANNGFALNKNGNTVTGLNLCIYNVTRNCPEIIKMVKHKNERQAFLDYIRYADLCCDNIYVFDRGFFGQNFIKNLDEKGIKYVCRIKKNCKYIKENENDTMVTIDNVNVRIVTYTVNNAKYYIATNLDDQFTCENISELYVFQTMGCRRMF